MSITGGHYGSVFMEESSHFGMLLAFCGSFGVSVVP